MKKLAFFYSVMLVLAMMAGCRSNTQSQQTDRMFCNCDFCTGDLVFVRDTADLSRFSHVAVMECTDSGVYSFEVHPTMGVVRCGWEESEKLTPFKIE